jgi:hypothetical protein
MPRKKERNYRKHGKKILKKEDIIAEMYRKKEKEKRKLKEDNRS